MVRTLGEAGREKDGHGVQHMVGHNKILIG